jgi:hypothetical protein
MAKAKETSTGSAPVEAVPNVSSTTAVKTDPLDVLKQPSFADGIEQFEKLMSQKRRAFLLGAGCSKCAGLPLTFELTDKVLSDPEISQKSQEILTAVKGLFGASKSATIEDFMSEIVDSLAIAIRRKTHGVADAIIKIGVKEYRTDDLEQTLKEIKESIARSINKEIHELFISAVHGLRAGKTENSSAVDYFVMNYDTLIEDSLAMLRLPYTDGFQGGPTGWWDDSLFNRSGLITRVVKLHGSIDWCRLAEGEMPRRIRGGNGLSKIKCPIH